MATIAAVELRLCSKGARLSLFHRRWPVKVDTLDYLIKSRSPQRQRRPISSEAQSAVDEAAITYGVPVLQHLAKAGGKLSLYDLVDQTGVNLETLLHVADLLADKFHWVTVDRSDLKGNYQISLEPEGRSYIDEALAAR